MKPKTKKVIIWSLSLLIGLPFILFVGFMAYAFYITGAFKAHPTDEELIVQLSENRSRYEQLITMFHADYPLTTVSPTSQYPSGQLSEDRWDKYKTIFAELGLDKGFRKMENESIWFLNSTRGMGTNGNSKGFIYRPVNPVPLYASLNERPPGSHSGGRGYRKIDENWYIIYDWSE